MADIEVSGIPDEIFAELEREAAERGITLNDLVVEALTAAARIHALRTAVGGESGLREEAERLGNDPANLAEVAEIQRYLHGGQSEG